MALPLAEQQRLLYEQLAPIFGAEGLQLPVPLRRENFPTVLRQIHDYWKSRVYELHRDWRDVTGKIKLKELEKQEIKADEEFNGLTIPAFKLGDRVLIEGTNKRKFKILHKKVGLWKENLMQLIGKEAIVINLSSHFAVGVAMIENGDMARIHGSALKELSQVDETGIWINDTEFKRNDQVIIGVEDAVLVYLQQNAKKTPFRIASQLRGIIGRVMGCFRGEVVVTFDEMSHELFNPASLKIYSEGERGLKITERGINMGPFQKGTNVQVISDGMAVMDLQRGHGEWSFRMTKFVGKEGIVTKTLEGGDVIVKFTPFEAYRMNRTSLEVVNEKTKNKPMSGIAFFNPLTFAVGDIVHLNIGPEDLLSNLQLLRIPMEFISVMECMTFVGYHNDLRAVVDIGNGRELIIDTALLAKAVDPGTFNEMKKKDSDIKVGSKVALFAGPKNCVKTFVKEFKPGFEEALDEVGTLEGYDDIGNAVISYNDGKLYSVPDENICSPRPHWHMTKRQNVEFMDWSKKLVEIPASVTSLEAAILSSVRDVLKKNEEKKAMDWTAKIQNMSDSQFKMIEITFPTTLDDFDEFTNKLKGRLAVEDCRMESNGQGRFIVMHNQQAYEMAFLLIPANPSNAEQYQKLATDVTAARSDDVGKCTSKEEVSEQPSVSNTALPFAGGSVNIPIPPGVSQVVLQIGGSLPQNQQLFAPVPIPQGQGPPANAGSVVVPGGQTIINMYGDGENKVAVNKSYVRSVSANSPN